MLLISNIVFEGLGLGSRQTHYFDKLKKLLFFKILVWVGSGGVVTTKTICFIQFVVFLLEEAAVLASEYCIF